MRFSSIARGVAQEHPTSYVVDGRTIPILLRPLTALEEVDVVADSIKYAKGKGISDPKDGHPIYEAALMAHTLALACLDPDSPPTAREPHFDGGVPQILAPSPGGLDTETIAVLHEQQRIWQDQCSPSVSKASAGEMIDLARKIARDSDPLVYVRLRPNMRWVYTRFTAALLCDLLDSKSESSSPTSSGSPSSESESASESSPELPKESGS